MKKNNRVEAIHELPLRNQKNIPDGWRQTRLSEVTPKDRKHGIVDGPFGSNLKTIHYMSAGIPIITSGYVTEGRFYAKNYLYVTKEKYEQEKRSSVKGGDIVMAKIGARCGASAILPKEHETGILSGNALKITVDEKRHVPKFIWQILWRLYYTGKITLLRNVGAQPAISMASLKKFKLIHPPLPEQKRIVAVLEVWDLVLEKLGRKIEIKKQIKKGLMRQLLTGKKRLHRFAGPWSTKKLSEIKGVSFFKGKGLPKSAISNNGEYACIHYGELFTKYPEIIKIIFNKTTFKEGAFLSRTNDVLMPTSDVTPNGLATASCINASDVVLGGDILIIRAGTILNGVFLAYGITANRRQVMSLVTGTTVYHLYASDMKKYKVSLPPTIKEQTAIANILTKADDEIEALEKKKHILEAQKKYLLNHLITGQIRTPEDLLEKRKDMDRKRK